MSQIRAIVLRAAGINCDLETQNAFELAGAEADRVHINRIIEDKSITRWLPDTCCPRRVQLWR